jgi:Bacterial archaeo-eukaryotic release factor family 11
MSCVEPGTMLHIDIPTLSEFKALAATTGEACVSLYVATSPSPDHARANRIAFKDLAENALSQLKAIGIDKRRMEPLQEQFDHLAGTILENTDDNKYKYRYRDPLEEIDKFWASQANMLAVLATLRTMRTFRLPERVTPLAVVANRFHLTPLIRSMTSRHDIFVLALSEEGCRLIHVFVHLPPIRVQVPGLPKNAEEATRRPSIHVRAPRRRLQNLEGEKVLLHKYARSVDRAVRRALAGQTAPLVLAAVEPIAAIFRFVNSYPHLIDEMIEENPDHVSDAQLEQASLPILDRLYVGELRAILGRYAELKPRRATTDVFLAAQAATAGAVEQLLVDLDALIPGRVSEVDGTVTYSSADDPEAYSVPAEVARRALWTGAQVLGAKPEELPDRASLVAILRYPFVPFIVESTGSSVDAPAGRLS